MECAAENDSMYLLSRKHTLFSCLLQYGGQHGGLSNEQAR